ncbi:MAG: hypothetical protein ACM3Q2_01610 [Syntrophothermus sp.]
MYVVKYSGPFGYLKPWTAVRDGETFSQQFLTPSTIEGIEKKLFPELLNKSGIFKLRSNRLNYQGLDMQQEKTWSKGGFSFNKEGDVYMTNIGIIMRGVLLNPNLYLAIENHEDAQRAFTQTICLCRNEDLVFPESISEMSEEKFDEIQGFELIPTRPGDGFKVGYNRYNNAEEMFGELRVIGNPIRE